MPILGNLSRTLNRRTRPSESTDGVAGSHPISGNSGPDGTGDRHFAADGMEINAPGSRPAAPLSRAEVIKAAKKADVPQRVQQGPTCGLYALAMVMDFWHAKDPQNAAPLVRDKDVGGKGKHYNFPPTTDERILDYAQESGFTAKGEMFTARQLAKVGAHYGYTAAIHEDATLEALYTVLDKGRPAVVAFDVDWNGNPGDYGGKRAHYAVIQGYFDQDGERYLVAKHGWGVQEDHVWKASDFDKSWKALRSTDFYGKPGDGLIPGEAEREPALLDLPELPGNKAGIQRSLATKIVELIPEGQEPTGGQIVAP
jgi:hypothetical protein